MVLVSDFIHYWKVEGHPKIYEEFQKLYNQTLELIEFFPLWTNSLYALSYNSGYVLCHVYPDGELKPFGNFLVQAYIFTCIYVFT